MTSQPPASSRDAGTTHRSTPRMAAGDPTVLLERSPSRQTDGGFHLWPRTVRWRLIASYALILMVMLIALGGALNIFLSRTLYATEFTFFQSEAVAAVGATQPRFDSLTLGEQPTCSDAVPYEEAFRRAIAQPIVASHPGSIQGVYLIDSAGNVLAPLAAQLANNGSAPYLQMARLRALEARATGLFAGATDPGGSRQLADTGYVVTNGLSPHGVELIALRYYTGARCATTPRAALGYVEIVTTFNRTQATLASLREVILLVVIGVFALGLALGGPLITAALAPLTRLTQAAQRVAAGDLSHRARLSHTDDEVGRLGAVFDTMLARIEAAFAATQRSQDRMRQFIADASHELRTPLTSIRGYTDVLLRGARNDPETTERVLLATRREAERMSRLVADLLTLARLDIGRASERRPVDIIALAGESVDQARILAGVREVTMRTDGSGALIVPGDPDQLKQVLLILLDNALKYGRLDAEGWARLSIQRRPGQAIITVEDNGPGVAPEDLPHVFERFYRAERAARVRRMKGAPVSTAPAQSANPSGAPEGSGLGLSIANAIALAHGGTLAAQSQPGSGATFTLTLPAEPEGPSTQRRTGRSTDALTESGPMERATRPG